jgi:hypothetical protein
MSALTSSSHRIFGLPSGLVLNGFHEYRLLTDLLRGIRSTWPSHESICVRIKLSYPNYNIKIHEIHITYLKATGFPFSNQSHPSFNGIFGTKGCKNAPPLALLRLTILRTNSENH